MKVPGSLQPVGILLTNVGTPEGPEISAVRRFLREFLGDRRIVDYPRWLWLPLLHGIILRVRPPRSAQLYRSIWTEEGSPLKIIMESIAEKLESLLITSTEQPVVVEIGMRYGKPSIAAALENLRAADVQKIFVFPLYPQYSGTTTGTSFDAVFDALQAWPQIPDLELISDYHDHPAYLAAIEQLVRSSWQDQEPPDKLLISFHGIPQRYARNGDPYPQQCEKTARMLASSLGLARHEWLHSYQSRFGPEPWLQPYTDETLEDLGRQGLSNLHIIAPGFSVDCLETLEELQVEGRNIFHDAGGGSFQYIPALNDHPKHIEALAFILFERMNGK
jgi:ferrochelatase